MPLERASPDLEARLAAALGALLLASAAFQLSPAHAANGGVDWTTMNSDADHANYVSQSQIGASNVADLQFQWTFPFPISPNVPGLAVTGQGAIAPPLVVNGTVYEVTNFLTVYAINAETGALVWSYSLTLNTTGLPLAPLAGHMHGINYYRGDIWVNAPDCSVDALDALNGSLVRKISDICANIPGNAGLYDSSGVPPVFDGNTMIWTSSVSEGTNAGRGFVAAYDLSTGRLLWRWYVAPPAGGDPNWDSDSCSTNATSSCHGNVAPYAGDWGAMGVTTVVNSTARHPLAGAGPSFGDPVVDTRNGMVFVSTSQASPDWNGTYRPGPDLYSDSIVALNATDGRMLWFYQTTPHDLYDFDCGWNTVLGNVTSGGTTTEAVFKACKNGYVYALGALSGKLLWYFDPPAVARSETGNADYVVTGNYSATLPWMNYPSTQPFLQCPGENGAIESDIAYAYSTVFVATYNLCAVGEVGPVGTEASNDTGLTYLQPQSQGANTTIYAVNASTGREVWNYSIPDYPYRGWLTASDGMLFAGSLDGAIHVFDAFTGKDIHNIRVGPALFDSPTFGSAEDGRVLMYELVGAAGYGAFAGPIPGALIAFALPPASAPPWPAIAAVASVLVLAVALVWRRPHRGPGPVAARDGPTR
jgi:alcohol dehydrogenase (cytochrome c)